MLLAVNGGACIELHRSGSQTFSSRDTQRRATSITFRRLIFFFFFFPPPPLPRKIKRSGNIMDPAREENNVPLAFPPIYFLTSRHARLLLALRREIKHPAGLRLVRRKAMEQSSTDDTLSSHPCFPHLLLALIFCKPL